LALIIGFLNITIFGSALFLVYKFLVVIFTSSAESFVCRLLTHVSHTSVVCFELKAFFALSALELSVVLGAPLRLAILAVDQLLLRIRTCRALEVLPFRTTILSRTRSFTVFSEACIAHFTGIIFAIDCCTILSTICIVV